jgi:hypothetical protein
MLEPTLNHYLALSAVLFAIGTAGVFLRRNLITILLSVEVMLNRVLRHDRRRRGSCRRPGDRHRAFPAP